MALRGKRRRTCGRRPQNTALRHDSTQLRAGLREPRPSARWRAAPSRKTTRREDRKRARSKVRRSAFRFAVLHTKLAASVSSCALAAQAPSRPAVGLVCPYNASPGELLIFRFQNRGATQWSDTSCVPASQGPMRGPVGPRRRFSVNPLYAGSIQPGTIAMIPRHRPANPPHRCAAFTRPESAFLCQPLAAWAVEARFCCPHVQPKASPQTRSSADEGARRSAGVARVCCTTRLASAPPAQKRRAVIRGALPRFADGHRGRGAAFVNERHAPWSRRRSCRAPAICQMTRPGSSWSSSSFSCSAAPSIFTVRRILTTDLRRAPRPR
eukprot:scaffold2141_cov282-Pinguiococcus_pyrenoidosus.AAC.11